MLRLLKCVVIVLVVTSSQGQILYQRPEVHNPPDKLFDFLEQGIEISAPSLDTFSLEWGFKASDIVDAARTGIEGAGWNMRSASPYQLVVFLQPIKSEGDDLHSFKLEISAAINSDEEAGVIDPIRTMKVLKIKKYDHPFMETNITQLSANVAQKLRRELLKLRLSQQNPDLLDRQDLPVNERLNNEHD